MKLYTSTIVWAMAASLCLAKITINDGSTRGKSVRRKRRGSRNLSYSYLVNHDEKPGGRAYLALNEEPIIGLYFQPIYADGSTGEYDATIGVTSSGGRKKGNGSGNRNGSGGSKGDSKGGSGGGSRNGDGSGNDGKKGGLKKRNKHPNTSGTKNPRRKRPNRNGMPTGYGSGSKGKGKGSKGGGSGHDRDRVNNYCRQACADVPLDADPYRSNVCEVDTVLRWQDIAADNCCCSEGVSYLKLQFSTLFYENTELAGSVSIGSDSGAELDGESIKFDTVEEDDIVITDDTIINDARHRTGKDLTKTKSKTDPSRSGVSATPPSSGVVRIVNCMDDCLRDPLAGIPCTSLSEVHDFVEDNQLICIVMVDGDTGLPLFDQALPTSVDLEFESTVQEKFVATIDTSCGNPVVFPWAAIALRDFDQAITFPINISEEQQLNFPVFIFQGGVSTGFYSRAVNEPSNAGFQLALEECGCDCSEFPPTLAPTDYVTDTLPPTTDWSCHPTELSAEGPGREPGTFEDAMTEVIVATPEPTPAPSAFPSCEHDSSHAAPTSRTDAPNPPTGGSTVPPTAPPTILFSVPSPTTFDINQESPSIPTGPAGVDPTAPTGPTGVSPTDPTGSTGADPLVPAGNPPTDLPTPWPTRPPTGFPTPLPTQSPPTDVPTPWPTRPPTSEPTNPPTNPEADPPIESPSAFPSCTDSPDGSPGHPDDLFTEVNNPEEGNTCGTAGAKSIYEYLCSVSNFSNFCLMIQRAGLQDLFAGIDGTTQFMTLFAPTNKGCKSSGLSTAEIETMDPDLLEHIVKTHATAGKITAGSLQCSAELPTLEGTFSVHSTKCYTTTHAKAQYGFFNEEDQYPMILSPNDLELCNGLIQPVNNMIRVINF